MKNVVAGEAENITACVAKAKEFARVSLDPFAVKYEGKVVALSTAIWPDAYCEVKLGQVYNLSVNHREIIYEGYAGKSSYDLAMSLQARTNDAIKQMRSRIALLEQRSNQASNSLRKPNPNQKHLAQYVDEGILKAIGSQVCLVPQNNGDNPKAISLSQQSNRSGTSANQPEIKITRTNPGDKGKYFLIEAKNDDGIYTTLHKRIGLESTGYSKTEIDCKKMQYRDMGYSEVSETNIEDKPGNWTELVDGSSKSDLVRFICN
jgi:hypothetical protein